MFNFIRNLFVKKDEQNVEPVSLTEKQKTERKVIELLKDEENWIIHNHIGSTVTLKHSKFPQLKFTYNGWTSFPERRYEISYDYIDLNISYNICDRFYKNIGYVLAEKRFNSINKILG